MSQPGASRSLLMEEVEKLNSEQKQVHDATGNCVVLAGPGTGKTRTLTLKLAQMLQEDVRPPRGIACITFSNECVREIERRLDKLGIRRDRRLFVGTVHSFCLVNIVKPYARLAELTLPDPLKIASEQDRSACFEQARHSCQSNSSQVEMDRHRRTCLDRGFPEWQQNGLSNLVEVYEEGLRRSGLLDFDDMTLLGLKIVQENMWAQKLLKARYPVLVVDEYQDLGLPLHRLVEILCFKAGIRLLAVGDPNQSIYGFNGARPDLLLDLAQRSGVAKFELHLNYRSGPRIVEASQQVIGQSGITRPQDGAQQGEICFRCIPEGLSEQARLICEEIIPELTAAGCKLGDIAVLYVDKNDGDIIATAAQNAHLKFIRIDRNAPYPKTRLTRWLEDCAIWCVEGWKRGDPRLSDLLRVWSEFAGDAPGLPTESRSKLVSFLWRHRQTGEQPPISLEKWISGLHEECLRFVFSENCEHQDDFEALCKLQQACGSQGALSGIALPDFAGQRGREDHLNLITLHQAKGREFEVVIMMGLEQGRLPGWRSNSSEEKAEARRLFYVGLTRAKKKVFLLYSGWYQNNNGQRFKKGASEFVIELQNSLAAKETV